MSTTISPRLLVVSLRAENLSKTVHFYRDVVGLRLIPHHGNHPTLELGHNQFLVIIQGKPDTEKYEGEGRFPKIAFAVDDLDAAIANLKAHDVPLPYDVVERADERWVMFHDPAGNLIEYVQFNHPPDS